MNRIVAMALGLAMLAAPALAQDQPAAQRGGCASGFCSMSNAPAQDAAQDQDIDAVDADMKRQLSGQRARGPQMAQQQMGGMMGMCPCMRMMSMMMQGRGMGGMGMPHMNMPGMMSPMPEHAPPKTE